MAFGLGLRISSHGLPELAVDTSVTPVTDGMTLSATWLNSGGGQGTLANSQEASIKVEGVFAPTNTGIQIEAGGTGTGLVVYIFGGVLYAQFGAGDGFSDAPNRATLEHTLTETVTLV